MALIDVFRKKRPQLPKISEAALDKLLTMEAELYPLVREERRIVNKHYITGGQTFAISVNFNGEKNLGEAGPIRKYNMDYEALRLRSWQAYLESEIAQTVINKYISWVIGGGLKLQSEPSNTVLKLEGILMDDQAFKQSVESRFDVYCKMNEASYSRQMNVDALAEEIEKNAVIGGDILVIKRYDKQTKLPSIQLVDGSHVKSPPFGDPAIGKGNKVVDGIEMDASGKHIAFWVCDRWLEYKRVAAETNNGLTVAFLHYGLRYRMDNHRGIPLITVVMEKLKKMERYDEATIGSAEERQKIPYFIEHGVDSTGENPLIERIAKASRADDDDDIPVTDDGVALADRIAVSTNKQVFNLGKNSKLVALESKNELYFKDFFTVNIDLVCAALGIPPNVAMSKYDSNFSASRAALKDWEHTLLVQRKKYSRQFYFHLYNFWLEIEILKNKVQAPGYLRAREEGNLMVVSAYRQARFIGDNVPHIDPVKEVEAERLKMGLSGASIPLTTAAAATESLNGGNSDVNIQQFSIELEESRKLKVTPEVLVPEPVAK